MRTLIRHESVPTAMSETKYLLPALKGAISVVEKDGKITDVLLHRSPPARVQGTGRIANDLRRFFAGEAIDLRGHEIDFSGYTEFQRRVLKATQRIPYGKTKSYGEVAKAAGYPGAARAVGQVMAHNRTCIFVPCHRVVASDGLGGFTGGTDLKVDLLKLEGSLDHVLSTPTRSTRTRNKSNKRRR